MSIQHRRRPPRKRPEAKNPNAPPDGASWIWWTKEMYESAAFQELVKHSRARIVVDRVAYEHLRHGAKENGRLKVTFDNFVAWGMSRSRVGDAIAIAEALGWIKLVERGRASFEDARSPNQFAVTWQAIGTALPTNDWKRIWSEETASARVAGAIKMREAERAANTQRNISRRLRNRPVTQFIMASQKQKAGT
jgi:hypothetical protein